MTSIDDELAHLRNEFARQSVARVHVMRETIAALGAEPANHEFIDRLHRHFHAFAGAGTTYGHPRATELGNEGEAILSQHLRAATIPSVDDLTTCRRMIEELSTCFPDAR